MLQDRNLADVFSPFSTYLKHKELLYSVCYSGTVNTAQTVALHITTPASTLNRYIHAEFDITTNLAGTVVLREGDTTTGGTGVTIYNYNRNSAKTSTCTALHDATVSAPGTTIRTLLVGATGTSFIKIPLKYILKPSLTYTLIFTAAADATTVSSVINLYEE
jgi:hypothetical protein